MRNIRYVGTKPSENAFFDKTQIVWTPGKVDTVLDEAVAAEMLTHAEFEDAGDASAPPSGAEQAILLTPSGLTKGGAALTAGERASVRGGMSFPTAPGGRKYPLAELLSWVKPTHKPVLDPLQFVGMAPLTSGVLTVSHQPSASEFPGMSFQGSMSGAGTAGVSIQFPALLSSVVPAGVRVGNRIHARVKCSDWSLVSFFYIDILTEGGTTKKYRWNLGPATTVYGNKDPAYASAWNDKFRTFIVDSSNVVASGSPAAWGTTNKYLTVTGIGITVVCSAAVTFEITRIYSPEWPVGMFVPIFDGWYSTAKEWALQNLYPKGYGCGGSVVQLDGAVTGNSYQPTPADVLALADAGFDVFMHGHDISGGSPVAMTSGTSRANMLKNHSQVRNALASISPKVAKSLRWHQWLTNAGTYAGTDLAGELKSLGVNAGRGKCSDSEWGINPSNATYVASDERWYQSWAEVRGRFNRRQTAFYAGLADGAGYFDATNTGDSTYPLMRDRIAYAANNAEPFVAYTHRINDTPTNTDSTNAFMRDMMADVDSRVAAGTLIVESPTTLESLTYWRPGEYFMRWDGEWVYRDDPTRIAF